MFTTLNVQGHPTSVQWIETGPEVVLIGGEGGEIIGGEAGERIGAETEE